LSQKILKSGGGRHRGEPLGDLLGGDLAGRVGVRRDQPHALERRVVGDQCDHRVDVGAVVGHRDRHHLDAEPLQQREVPVVAGHRADEADLLLGAPRALGVDAALEPQVGEDVLHQGQARGPLGGELVELEAEQLREHRPELGHPGETAVVAGIHAVGGGGRRREREQPVGQVELLGRGLATRQVQLQAGRDQGVVRRLLGVAEGGQLGWGQLGQGLVLTHPPMVSEVGPPGPTRAVRQT